MELCVEPGNLCGQGQVEVESWAMSFTTGRRSRAAASSCAWRWSRPESAICVLRGTLVGVAALLRFLDGRNVQRPPFAPPFLKAGRLVIGQTANILQYLGQRHGLAPKDERGRLWTHELQLTIADLLGEIHDPHHPVAPSLYYAQQRKEARRRAADFLRNRAPKYLNYFERTIAKNARGKGYLAGARLTYADLSMFQIMAGLNYAFP